MKNVLPLIVALAWGMVWNAATAAESVRIGAPAPAPVLLTSAGDSYRFLSDIYGADPESAGRHRSAVALLFVDPDSAAGDSAVPAFMEVARKVHARETLRGQIRFFLVCPEGAGFAFARFLEQPAMAVPVDVLLDPRQKARTAFGVEDMPRLFVISRAGILAADVAGVPANFRRQLAEGVVAAIQAGRTAPPRTAPPAAAQPAGKPGDPRQPMAW
ncbi:MAG: hypothetical protein AB7V22_05920 [Kiritimatiellia bacterium]